MTLSLGRGLPMGLALLILTVFSAPVQAGKINRYTALSAEYGRSLHRYAAVELDAAFYNPAGLVFGKEGFGLKLINQSTYLDNTFTNANTSTTDGGFAWFAPGLMAAAHYGDFALHATLGAVAGGLTEFTAPHPVFDANKSFVLEQVNQVLGVDVVDDATFDGATLEAGTLYLGLTFGLAYQICDELAVSVGGKYIDGRGRLKLAADFQLYIMDFRLLESSLGIEAEQTGSGVGMVFGVHARPLPGTDIALRWEPNTAVEMVTKVKEDTQSILVDGEKSRNDIPGTVSLGVGQVIAPNLRLLGSFAYFMNTDAQFGPLLGFDITGKLEDGWETGLGLEYQAADAWLLSAGHIYFDTGHTKESRTVNRFFLDGHFAGAGASYTAGDALRITTAFFGMFYNSATTELGAVELDQKALVWSLDVDYWF